LIKEATVPASENDEEWMQFFQFSSQAVPEFDAPLLEHIWQSTGPRFSMRMTAVY
jgi:hypothetical protein